MNKKITGYKTFIWGIPCVFVDSLKFAGFLWSDKIECDVYHENVKDEFDIDIDIIHPTKIEITKIKNQAMKNLNKKLKHLMKQGKYLPCQERFKPITLKKFNHIKQFKPNKKLVDLCFKLHKNNTKHYDDNNN